MMRYILEDTPEGYRLTLGYLPSDTRSFTQGGHGSLEAIYKQLHDTSLELIIRERGERES